MIGKARTGADFQGLSLYLTEGGEGRVGYVETRNVFEPEDRPVQVAEEMEDAAAASGRVEKPVYHLSISFPVEDETGPEGRLEVTEEVLGDLGLGDHQAMIVEHQDESHPHVHVMVNRVQHRPEAKGYGKAWQGSYDWQQIEESLRRIERERGWRQVPGYHARPEGAKKPSPALTTGEIHQYKRTGQLPFGDVVAEVAGHHFEEATSWRELEKRLREHGIWVEAKGRGGVVTDGNETCKLSDVGRDYSRYKLEEKFDQTHAEYREQRKQRGRQRKQQKQKQQKRKQREQRGKHSGGDAAGAGAAEREQKAAAIDGEGSGSTGGEGEPVGRDGGPASGEPARGGQAGPREPAGGAAGSGTEGGSEGSSGAEVDSRESDRGGNSGEGEGGVSAVEGEGRAARETNKSESGASPAGRRASGESEPGAEESREREEKDEERPLESPPPAGEDGGRPGDEVVEEGVDRPGRGSGRDNGSGGGRVGKHGDAPSEVEDDSGGDPAGRGAGEARSRNLRAPDGGGIRDLPEALEEGVRAGPGLTEVSQLSERGRGIWEQISEGEEEAARAFDRLGKEEQRALVKNLDSFDREALREGYEKAIERDAPEQEQTQGNARDRSRGGQSRGRGHGGRGR